MKYQYIAFEKELENRVYKFRYKSLFVAGIQRRSARIAGVTRFEKKPEGAESRERFTILSTFPFCLEKEHSDITSQRLTTDGIMGGRGGAFGVGRVKGGKGAEG